MQFKKLPRPIECCYNSWTEYRHKKSLDLIVGGDLCKCPPVFYFNISQYCEYEYYTFRRVIHIYFIFRSVSFFFLLLILHTHTHMPTLLPSLTI